MLDNSLINDPIKIMIVDDSLVVREFIIKAFAHDPSIKIIAIASNGQIAINYLKEYDIEVIILDVTMPVMDGITALPKLLEQSPKTKIVMVSSLTSENSSITIEALNLGAADFILKPSAYDSNSIQEFNTNLIEKIYALALSSRRFKTSVKHDHVLKKRTIKNTSKYSAIAIASSTGGPQALLKIFSNLNIDFIKNFPIFITQHMPPFFTKCLADNIANSTNFDCHEAIDNEIVNKGSIYIAPGGYHMLIEKINNNILIKLSDILPAENFCRPSADPMIRSLSGIYKDELLVLILTGMGKDGLEGARIANAAGAKIIAQDEATSIVWGMPGAVANAKLTSELLPLNEISSYLLSL